MKVTKHGKKFEKKEKFEEFTCENCGCEFSLKEDEYYTHEGGADFNNSICGTISVSSHISDYLVCSCPECHKIVKKVSKRVNVNYADIIVTGTSNTNRTNLPYTEATWTNEDVLSEIMECSTK